MSTTIRINGQGKSDAIECTIVDNRVIIRQDSPDFPGVLVGTFAEHDIANLGSWLITAANLIACARTIRETDTPGGVGSPTNQ